MNLCCFKLPKVKLKVTQSCPTLSNPMDYTVHGILQARILEWVAFPFSRGSSQPRDWTQVSCIAGEFFTSWATRKALKPPNLWWFVTAGQETDIVSWIESPGLRILDSFSEDSNQTGAFQWASAIDIRPESELVFEVFAEATGVDKWQRGWHKPRLSGSGPGLVSNANDSKRRKYSPQNRDGPLDNAYML